MQKKHITIILLLLSLLITSCTTTLPEDNPEKITIYYFFNEACMNCEEQLKFLQELKKENQDIELKKYNTDEEKNEELLQRFAEAYNERIITPPATFIAEEAFIGFGSKQTTGMLITDKINKCTQTKCKNPADILRKYYE